MRSAMRNFAHLLRELSASSHALAVMGFFVMIFSSGFLPHTHTGKFPGHVQGFSKLLNASFTILSSND
jgi:hypothetical protein